jgi:HEPN domain-containing protein
MLQTRRYLYVAFLSQQAVEKILKACYVKYRASTPPYTHNLLRLVAELPWKDEVGSQRMHAMERLNSHYIESRLHEDIADCHAF